MTKIAAAAILFKELVRYVVTRHTGQFHDYLQERLLENALPPWSRGIVCALAVNAALSKRSYAAALSAARTFAAEFPWEEVSSDIVTKLFEVALIFGDQVVARRALAAIGSRREGIEQMHAKLQLLWQWRFVGLLAKEAEPIDLRDVYFGHFAEYDQYFKGTVAELCGEAALARESFKRALQLAPDDATELRAAIKKRVEQLSAGIEGGSSR